MRIFVAPDNGGVPNAVITGPFVSIPFPRRARDRHLVIARDMTSAPAGCFDLGDPLDPVNMAATLSTPERNAVADAFGEARSSFTGMTRQQVLVHMLDHPSGARFCQARFVGRALNTDIIGNIFTQTKPTR